MTDRYVVTFRKNKNRCYSNVTFVLVFRATTSIRLVYELGNVFSMLKYWLCSSLKRTANSMNYVRKNFEKNVLNVKTCSRRFCLEAESILNNSRFYCFCNVSVEACQKLVHFSLYHRGIKVKFVGMIMRPRNFTTQILQAIVRTKCRPKLKCVR